MVKEENINEFKDKVVEGLLIADYLKKIVAPQMPLYFNGTDFHNKEVCRCPFHDDDGESMKYGQEEGEFECEVCGASGSVIDLHRKFMKLFTGIEPTYDDSVELLYRQLENKK